MSATEVDGWDGEWVEPPWQPRPGPRTWDVLLHGLPDQEDYW